MADEKAARPAPKPTTGRVLRVERLTPHMIRVVLGGEGLAGFRADEFTDHYVKLLFAPAGVSYPEPFDPEAIRRDLPREQWPTTRTYTVRRWDAEAGELTIDFVHHGDDRPRRAVGRPGPAGRGAPLLRSRRRLRPRPGRRLAPVRGRRERAAGHRRLAGARSPPGPGLGLHRGRGPRGGAADRLPRRREARLAAPPGRPGRRDAGQGGPRGSTSPTTRCTPSCTARRASSASSGATCAPNAASRWRSCRSPATGGWAATTRPGAPPSASGTSRVEAEEAAALSS